MGELMVRGRVRVWRQQRDKEVRPVLGRVQTLFADAVLGFDWAAGRLAVPGEPASL